MVRFIRALSLTNLARTISLSFIGLIAFIAVFASYFYSLNRSSALVASETLGGRLVSIMSQNAEQSLLSINFMLADYIGDISGHKILEQTSLRDALANRTSSEALISRMQNFPAVKLITIYDEYGQSIVSSNSSMNIKVDFKARGYKDFISDSYGSFAIGNVNFNRVFDRLMFYLVRPIRAPDNTIVGYINAAIDPITFIGTTAETQQQFAQIALFNNEGFYFAANPDMRGYHRNIVPEEDIKSLFTDNMQSIHEYKSWINDYDDQEKYQITLMKRIGHFPLGISFTIYRDDIFAPWYNRSWEGKLFIFIVISALICLGLIVRFLYQKQGQILQQLTEANQKSAQALEAKSEFLAMMSHELRTPMNSVIGMSGMLLHTHLNKEQEYYTRIINTAADQLLAVINEILDFSRLDAGSERAEKAPFHLGDLIHNVMEVVEGLPHAYALDLKTEIAMGVPISLIGDASHLTQILINLLSNAVKFTKEGSVILSIKPYHFGDKKVTLAFEVKDTGQGMDEQRLAKLFISFERGAYVSRTGQRGTGLGLAITHRLVTLLGGRISVTSQVGKGTHFICYIPFDIAPTSNLIMPPVQKPSKAERRLRILAAEDTPANQLVLRALLERQGHFVQIVANGSEAIAALNRGQFDLVILDLQMPVMDGFEAAYAIRHMNDLLLRHIPIFALSAYSRIEDQNKAYEAGVTDFITKPVRELDLASVIARHFGSEKHQENVHIGESHLSYMQRTLSKAQFKDILDQFIHNSNAAFLELENALDGTDAARVKLAVRNVLDVFSPFGISSLHGHAQCIHEDNSVTIFDCGREVLKEGKHIMFEVSSHFIAL
jgi:signal transduction histidine kinase/DNA-binding response OmpR family regulator